MPSGSQLLASVATNEWSSFVCSHCAFMVLRKGHIPVLAVRVFIFVWGTDSVNTKLCKT